jgi:tetratricopeptide (TPR) repeat protein
MLDLLVSECNNALRLIKNFKVKESTKEEKEKAKKMEIILLLRKGRALVNQNDIQKAIEQYESALDLDPDNEKIQQDVEKLKQSI